MSELVCHQFPCRDDNYGVLVHCPETGETASIDAPEEAPVLAVLKEKGWKLTHILTTHHHGDHVAGNKGLKSKFNCEITGPEDEKAKIPGIDRTVAHGDSFEFAGHRVDVIGTPGHTLGEISYHFPDDKLLFAGDTLFALGCGRVFEGDAAMMWQSLQRLIELPDDTEVYAGHEYTLSNAKFAVTVDPHNAVLAARKDEIEKSRAAGKPTLPTNLGIEKTTNPFLRPDDTSIRATLGMENASDTEVFAEIRARKDRF